MILDPLRQITFVKRIGCIKQRLGVLAVRGQCEGSVCLSGSESGSYLAVPSCCNLDVNYYWEVLVSIRLGCTKLQAPSYEVVALLFSHYCLHYANAI
jgi:hypothetical protein